MAKAKTKFTTMEGYIASFPEDIRAVLEKIRDTIAKAAPRAEPVISYQMPAFKQGRVLLFFAAWKDHFSLFVPSETAFQVFRARLAKYEIHKVNVKFPLAGPIPYALIAALTRHRVQEEGGTAAVGESPAGKPVLASRKGAAQRTERAGRSAETAPGKSRAKSRTKTLPKPKAARKPKAGRGPKRKAGA